MSGDWFNACRFIGIALLLRSAASWWSRFGGGAGGDVRSSATVLSCSKWSSNGGGILFSLSKTEGYGGMCGRDMCIGEQDSPYSEAPTLGSDAYGCSLSVFPILRRQISWQTCCPSINLSSNSPNHRVKDQGYGLPGLLWRHSTKAARTARDCESRSAVPVRFGNRAIRLCEDRYQQADRGCE